MALPGVVFKMDVISCNLRPFSGVWTRSHDQYCCLPEWCVTSKSIGSCKVSWDLVHMLLHAFTLS